MPLMAFVINDSIDGSHQLHQLMAHLLMPLMALVINDSICGVH
jgi:hypothetical protein